MDGGASMRWLVTGASGTLGSYLIRELAQSERSVHGWSRSTSADVFGVSVQPIDLAQREAVTTAFRAARPDVIIHAAALARIAECLMSPDTARRINTEGTQLLAELAATTGARLVYVSTDLVFDGENPPYRENDQPQPLSVYGRSKADAEPAVLAVQNSVVARVSLLFGPPIFARSGFFTSLVEAIKSGRAINLFADEWRTPLSLADAARALCVVARSDFAGTIHLGGPERLSRLEMGQRLARFLKLSDASLVAGQRDNVAGAEPRPRDVSLNSSLWHARYPRFAVADFETALADMLNR